MKKLIFFLLILFALSFANSVQAAGCGYMCGDAANPTAVCTAIGGTIGSEFGNNASCDSSQTNKCGTYEMRICCCTASDNMISPSDNKGDAVAPPPKFTIPDLQINLPGLVLSHPTCEPNDDNGYQCKVNWLGEYLTWIYNYALKVGGILAAIMLMAGGLLWLISGGDAGKVGQAKEIIIGSITGLIILMSSYVILIQVNPELVSFPSITLGALTKNSIPAPENTTAFSSKCKPTTTGPCAVANMSIFGSRAEQASAICMAESGGNPSVSNKLTKCDGDGYAVWGLFQFNLSANKFKDENGVVLNCPKAYSKTWTNSSPTCAIVDRALYDACVKAATTPELSIKNAYDLAKNGWGPWEANSKWCGF